MRTLAERGQGEHRQSLPHPPVLLPIEGLPARSPATPSCSHGDGVLPGTAEENWRDRKSLELRYMGDAGDNGPADASSRPSHRERRRSEASSRRPANAVTS
jgi:hypothetical protein